MANSAPELSNSMPEGDPLGKRINRRHHEPGNVEGAAERFRAALIGTSPDANRCNFRSENAFRVSQVDELINHAVELARAEGAGAEQLSWIHSHDDTPQFRSGDSDEFILKVRRHVMAYAGHQYLEHIRIEELRAVLVDKGGDITLLERDGVVLKINDISAQVLRPWLAESTINVLGEFLDGYTLEQVFCNQQLFVNEYLPEFLRGKDQNDDRVISRYKDFLGVALDSFGQDFWGWGFQSPL